VGPRASLDTGEKRKISFPCLKAKVFFKNIIWMCQYPLFWQSLMPCCLFKLKHFFHEIKSPSSGTLLKGVLILFSLTYGPMASKTSFLDRPKHHFSNFSLSFKGQSSWLTHFMALYPSQSINIFIYCSIRYCLQQILQGNARKLMTKTSLVAT